MLLEGAVFVYLIFVEPHDFGSSYKTGSETLLGFTTMESSVSRAEMVAAGTVSFGHTIFSEFLAHSPLKWTLDLRRIAGQSRKGVGHRVQANTREKKTGGCLDDRCSEKSIVHAQGVPP